MWSSGLDVRLSEWCCSVSMVWVQIPSREEQKYICVCVCVCVYTYTDVRLITKSVIDRLYF